MTRTNPLAADLFAGLPPPQRLALSYSPAAARPATLALLLLDARLAAVVRQRREPVLAQMRLAWWRDILAADPGGWPAGEPLLALLGVWRDPAALVPLVDAWEGLLGETLDASAIDAFAAGRSEAFVHLALALGADPDPVVPAARLWVLGDLAANVSNPAERAAAIEAASDLRPARLPRSLRTLAVLAGLARRSLDRGGTPLLDGRGAALAAVRLGIAGR